jgi:hypothetical protein
VEVAGFGGVNHITSGGGTHAMGGGSVGVRVINHLRLSHSRRRASWLLPVRDPAQAPAYLRYGNSPPAREPACRHATFGA